MLLVYQLRPWNLVAHADTHTHTDMIERWPHDIQQSTAEGLVFGTRQGQNSCSPLLHQRFSTTPTTIAIPAIYQVYSPFSISLHNTLVFFPFFCFKSVCPLPLSSPLPSRLVSHLGSRWPAGTVPLEFPASCREIDESEVPWRLQRGLWGGRHGGQAPSNTKQAELMGMLLRKKREERRERCAHI